MDQSLLHKIHYFCRQNKKNSSQCCNFQKYCLSLPHRSVLDDDIEESYLALTRQRIWKIQRVRAKSLKAVPPAVAYILLFPLWDQLTYIPAGVS